MEKVLEEMVIKFMQEQNTFNLKIIERISKAEVRIYLVMTIISLAIGGVMRFIIK